MNASKTQLMLGGKVRRVDLEDFHVVVDGVTVFPDKKLELGVKFDSTFCTFPHEASVSASARQRAAMIARLSHHLPRGAYLQQLARGLVLGKQAGLSSLNELTVHAVAKETWRAFHSQDGPDGSRNALGQVLFPYATRSTRSEAAGVVSPHLPYAANTLVDNGIAMFNKFPALREASTKWMASNVANYECNADYKFSDGNTSKTITCQADGTWSSVDHCQDAGPRFLYTFIDQTLQPGPSVSLKCSAAGNPTPNIRWTLDGFSLPDSERFMIGQYVSSHGDVISHLNITQARIEDGGRYFCQAHNRAGSVSHSSRLNVYGAPFIRRFPTPLRAIEGKPFLMICPAAGFPIEEITWTKDGRILIRSPDLKVFPQNGTLIINSVSRSRDEGFYTCRARNRQGQGAEGSTNLKVIGKSGEQEGRAVSPQILPFNVPTRLQRGDRLSLTCTVFKGNQPLDLSWLVDDHSLQDPAMKSIRIDEFTSMLSIPSLSHAHNGNYSCLAANEAGEARYSQPITVHVPPEIVPFPTSSQVVQREGIRTRLLCGLARGDLPITFRWLKDGAQALVKPSDLLQITSVDDFSSLLTFVSLQSHHSGNYTCVAENSAGRAEFTAQLTVKGTS
eukprot:maker-scaffold10_size831480-snap-gene-7.22 protein:Tk01845 transcript:maker-scaffold10_size831480-snap-gene-7.22-mRNA-1 annotation:"down syndrome cell adhesion molecule-like protein"